MKNPHTIRVAAAILLLAAGLSMGCASMNSKTKGAIIGGAAGGVAGGVIGNQVGSTTAGVLIGAVIGGTAGAIIGHQMDQRAKELEQSIPGARVTRVGEGIAITFDSGLLFDFDSDQIRGAAQSNLNALAANINKYPETEIMIVGHTDDIGSSSYNQGLSERRASSASSYLRSQGVAKSIDTRGRGENEPIASNESEAGRDQNRRVEVALYASAEQRQAAVRAANNQ
jgi:outer membrane protein OmpA-like peptidoglycan-associated protein